MPTTYTKRWFAGQAVSGRRSAKVLVPLVAQLLRPTSVVDVGCSTGSWLAEFMAAGVTDILGFDGDYVDRSMLVIPAERFRAHDLRRPIPVDRRFDLAMSLEVAEHLPESAAAPLVRALTEMAPIVLFGAAIPGQGGTNHVNEQWQSYWVSLFRDRGYSPLDAVRPSLWTNTEVEPWYRQNTLLYASAHRIAQDPRLQGLRRASEEMTVDLVHPELFEIAREEAAHPLRTSCRRAIARTRRAIGSFLPNR